MGALVMKALDPVRRKPVPWGTAVVRIAKASDPESGSVIAWLPINVPSHRPGKYRCFGYNFSTSQQTSNSQGMMRAKLYNVTTSANAVLTVTAGAPTFTRNVPSYVETVGDHLAFSAGVNGTLPISAQWYFNTTNNPIAGATTHHEGEASINHLMTTRAAQVMIVADRSKLGQRAFARVCAMDEIDVIVTDQDAAPGTLAAFTERGIRVVTA